MQLTTKVEMAISKEIAKLSNLGIHEMTAGDQWEGSD